MGPGEVPAQQPACDIQPGRRVAGWGGSQSQGQGQGQGQDNFASLLKRLEKFLLDVALAQFQ